MLACLYVGALCTRVFPYLCMFICVQIYLPVCVSVCPYLSFVSTWWCQQKLYICFTFSVVKECHFLVVGCICFYLMMSTKTVCLFQVLRNAESLFLSGKGYTATVISVTNDETLELSLTGNILTRSAHIENSYVIYFLQTVLLFGLRWYFSNISKF